VEHDNDTTRTPVERRLPDGLLLFQTERTC
jgi:hypothetical protein